MNPQDTVERVLKEIHVAFAQCPTYADQPEKIVMDRRQFMELLDRLNNGIFDMMESYEQTRQSRLAGEREFQKKGNEIVDAANQKAEDVYAASVIYTADSIARIKDLMDRTNDSMNDVFRMFRKELRAQKDLLKINETELESQLADMVDTKKYLSIIRDMNTERDRQNRDLQAAKESGNLYRSGMMLPQSPQPQTADQSDADKPEIKINSDAAYFKWKAQKEGVTAEDLAAGVAAEKEQAELPRQEIDPVEELLKETSFDISNDVNRPDEDAILKAVLEDERQMEFGDNEEKRSGPSAGEIFKNIIFGKTE